MLDPLGYNIIKGLGCQAWTEPRFEGLDNITLNKFNIIYEIYLLFMKSLYKTRNFCEKIFSCIAIRNLHPLSPC